MSCSHNCGGDDDGPFWVFIFFAALFIWGVIAALMSAINSGPGLSPGG